METAVVIPAYKPDKRLLAQVEALRRLGFAYILVINDGSPAECGELFQQLSQISGCQVLHHPTNRGKGAALKTGLRSLGECFPQSRGCVTTDCDGRYPPEDVLLMARTVEEHPDSLVLGRRSFKGEDVPRQSRWGNKISTAALYLVTGMNCGDPQSGLRGIPQDLIPALLETGGDRHEFEINTLIHLAREGIPIFEVPVRTLQHKERISRIRLLIDFIHIYSLIVRFALVSAASSGLDLLAFFVLHFLVLRKVLNGVFVSNVLARILSGLVGYILNKKLVFRSKGRGFSSLVKYGALFLFQLTVSTFWVGTVAGTRIMPVMLGKVLVDGLLLVLNFWIQRRWIFPPAKRTMSKLEVEVLR